MRLVVDLQGAQGSNRMRGIGRYALLFAQALVRNRGGHEVLIALNGMFPETIAPIRSTFHGLLPQNNIRVWDAVSPVAAREAKNEWRLRASSIVREGFLAALKPDIVHISSLFEGFVDNVVTGVDGRESGFPTSVSLFDLIPHIHAEHYLAEPAMRRWYAGKLEELRRADLCLAISESSRLEGIDHLGLSATNTINVSCDADPMFRRVSLTSQERSDLIGKFGLKREFVMYTGGIDFRKNVEGLIRAFGALPSSLRARYQLVIVCAIDPATRHRLESLARAHGFGKDELVLTGYVPDADLLALYNCCALFVFPSWHEGFGLPLLEAMRCGAPVIGARASSLVEILDFDAALFEPRSDEAMSQAMAAALANETLRAQLIENGGRRSKAFSWDKTAQQALSAMEALHVQRAALRVAPTSLNFPKRRLAYVSPLPPLRTGIADYSAELLPELNRHYEVEVISDQNEVSDSWIKENLRIRPVDWFRKHSHLFDRVLYHFGNSEFHQHMFDLLEEIPGVVVLHDFYLSGVIAHRGMLGDRPGYWLRELYHSHGYLAAVARASTQDCAEVIWEYPCNLRVLASALGTIAHSNYSVALARRWYNQSPERWAVVPLLRVADRGGDRVAARHALGLKEDSILVCSFGLLGPTKLNHRLIEAWSQSSLALDPRCRLVFVGQNESGAYGASLVKALATCGGRDRVSIAGWSEKETFKTYLAAADIAVQLRARSRGETSAAVLDCMNHGIATIVNANGSQAELSPDAVYLLRDDFSNEELATALDKLRDDAILRNSMGSAARRIIQERHDPARCARKYFEAVEKFYAEAPTTPLRLARAIAALDQTAPSDGELVSLGRSIARSFPSEQPQLLVDVSELVKRDGRSGIQRAVRKILEEWLLRPPSGYRVEPVYAELGQGYRYARRFTMEFLGCAPALSDEPIDFAYGDVFVGLDLQPQVVPEHRRTYQEMRRCGVRVVFLVYDLLCMSHPECFYPGATEGFSRWLTVVAESSAAICISKSVADELGDWVDKHASESRAELGIEWFHLGADFVSPAPRDAPPVEAFASSNHDSAKTFLMVGTIEPRKRHAQVLDAFDELWRDTQLPVRLLIVGKEGWLMEPFIARLRKHPELGRRLQWWHDCSDEELQVAYASSTCLIAASLGEGFGLPIVEAAQRGLPVIARDLPVFRELAEDKVYYFAAEDGYGLSLTIKDWINARALGLVPSCAGIRVLSWRESAARLAELCTTKVVALARAGASC